MCRCTGIHAIYFPNQSRCAHAIFRPKAIAVNDRYVMLLTTRQRLLFVTIKTIRTYVSLVRHGNPPDCSLRSDLGSGGLNLFLRTYPASLFFLVRSTFSADDKNQPSST